MISALGNIIKSVRTELCWNGTMHGKLSKLTLRLMWETSIVCLLFNPQENKDSSEAQDLWDSLLQSEGR